MFKERAEKLAAPSAVVSEPSKLAQSAAAEINIVKAATPAERRPVLWYLGPSWRDLINPLVLILQRKRGLSLRQPWVLQLTLSKQQLPREMKFQLKLQKFKTKRLWLKVLKLLQLLNKLKKLPSSLSSLSARPQEISSSTLPSTKSSSASHSNTTTGPRRPATVLLSPNHYRMAMRATGSMDKSKAWAPWNMLMVLNMKDGGWMARKKEWARCASPAAKSSMAFGETTSSQPASWSSRMAHMYTRATGSRSSDK